MKIAITLTPSNTPTISPSLTPTETPCPTLTMTASHTPTLTPTPTSTPTIQYYFQPLVEICNASYPEPLDLTGYTLTFNSQNYTQLTQYIDQSSATYCAVGPVNYGTTGTTYRFDFVINDSNYELCGEPFSGLTYDRIDIELVNYLGEYMPNEKEWDVIYYYYLGGTLVYTNPYNLIFYGYSITENPNCSLINLAFSQSLRFIVRQKVLATPTPTPTITQTSTPTSTLEMTPTNTSSPTNTPTNTATPTYTASVTPTNTTSPTPTPSVTYCYNPTAILLFDSYSGRTAMRDWMATQPGVGTFRGLFYTSPSLTQSTFQAQMNAYINYTGYGISTYSLIQSGISYNQDPIIIDNNVNEWSSDYTWISFFVPLCSHCEGYYSLIGNSSPSYLVNTTWVSRPFYYSGTTIPQGYYTWYTTYTDTAMRQYNYEFQYSLGDLICTGATPTPTVTSTITPTPSITASQTQTPSMTPTMTPTSAVTYCAQLEVRTEASLNIPITGVDVNGTPVSYLYGTNFPITPSDAPGYFNTNLTGTTQQVKVYYGTNIAGQHIELTDCDNVTQCCDLNPGGGYCIFDNVNLSCLCDWYIRGYDGTCV